jgi:hypothetical protein
LQNHVHNRDIPTSVTSILQRDVANFFRRDPATGVSAYCVVAAIRVVCSNKNPGIAAGVLHFFDVA